MLALGTVFFLFSAQSALAAGELAPRQAKVLIVGWDGVRADCLEPAHTPVFDELSRFGTLTLDAWTGPRTVSGPSWTSILTGVWPGKHGVLDNSFQAMTLAAYPTVFSRLTLERASATSACVAQWGPIHDNLGHAATWSADAEDQEDVARRAVEILEQKDPDLMFLHFDGADGAGHSSGYSADNPAYLEAIERADSGLGEVLKAIAARPRANFEDWLILITTDHGGTGTGHGKDILEHRQSFILASGPSVGERTFRPKARIVDLVPTALAHLGLEPEEDWGLDGLVLGTHGVPKGERMDWWREARFGLFLHWGLYSIPAGAWGGSTGHAEWIRTTAQIPRAVYSEFKSRFNPEQFDAEAWVLMAKAAGMRYIVITSKHHDGFGLFDSAHTDWDVMGSPFQRDILKELAEACRRHGLKMCWYHSIMDWYHPDYLPRRGWEKSKWPEDEAVFSRFVDFLHRQVRELLTQYGDIGVMWFDGEWEATWTHELGIDLDDLVRSLQPRTIVNNRVDKGRAGMAGMTTDERFRGDYGTPEQEVPATGFPGVDWESCITMNRYWGWNEADKQWKSTTDLIRMLVDIASKGGNLLLNVGPKADGTFPAQSIVRLREIGDWMDIHGEAIYGTEASPFEEIAWGRCTSKPDKNRSMLYFHVFDWPEDGMLDIPGLANTALEARFLSGEGRDIPFEATSGGLRLRVPPEPPDIWCPVIAVEVDGAPVVFSSPSISAASSRFVDSLVVTLTTPTTGGEIRFTSDGSVPGPDSRLYEEPILLKETSAILKAVTVFRGRVVSPVVEDSFEKVSPWPDTNLGGGSSSGKIAAGLHRGTLRGNWDVLPSPESSRLEESVLVSGIAIPSGPAEENVFYRFEGWIDIPTEGLWLFELISDDGSRLWLDEVLVVDHDGLHGASAKQGDAPLQAGLHHLRVDWFNKTGGAELALRIANPGEDFFPIPLAWFSHEE